MSFPKSFAVKSALAVLAAALVASACTTRETRVVYPAVVTPATTTVIVPNQNPDVVVKID